MDPRSERGRKGVVLIDNVEDNEVEDRAYVEVFDPKSRKTSYAGVQSKDSARKHMEKLYPREAGDEIFMATGAKIWMSPDAGHDHNWEWHVDAGDWEGDLEWPALPWRECKPDDPNALCFWVVEVKYL